MYTRGSSYVYMPKLLSCLVSYVYFNRLLKRSCWVCSLFWKNILLSSHYITGKKNTIINTTTSCLLKSRLFWDTTWVLSPWSSNTFLFCNVPYPSKTKGILLSFLLVLFYSMLQRNSLLIKTDYFIFSMQTTIKETNTSNILAKLKVARCPHF